ncbi:putative serine protease K12H4.7 [Belonocnema kinseyi]|uniref:putative serine protease K12H4.7 n=1 Tax=Belonocnema kinseyi TaxID=2817044 RepID=UPI00143CFF75|nr:putative serine protease K12H4.7 [Belonocnema kinseyi]
MDLFNLIAILTSVVYCVESVGFRGFFYEGMKEPESSEWKKNNLVKHRWITQSVDHFHIQDNRTWKMRFLENDEYFNGTGPILIMLGGEWKINEGFLNAGLMHKIGDEHGALMYYTEHRYYGDSKPFEDTSTENLKYLNADQALADVAYFIEFIKKERNLNNTMVTVFGGSYAGNMAVWMRLKYPHLVQGALASSAPVYAKADFPEYLEVVTASLKRHSVECVTEIEKAIVSVQEMVHTEVGRSTIKDEFNLCHALDTTNLSGLGTFFSLLTETFSSVVQYNRIKNGTSSIAEICKTMTNNSIGCPIQRLAKVTNNNGECVNIDYSVILDALGNTSWVANSDSMRQWIFQTCTEYGYYQTTDPEKSIFGSILTIEYFNQLCGDVFGEGYDKILLDKGVRRTNVMYGGKLPDVKNVLFVNGNIDPWHALSVLNDLNESSPSILIDGSSHCMDLQNDNPNDVPELTKARIKIRNIIGQWVKSWREISNEVLI